MELLTLYLLACFFFFASADFSLNLLHLCLVPETELALETLKSPKILANPNLPPAGQERVDPTLSTSNKLASWILTRSQSPSRPGSRHWVSPNQAFFFFWKILPGIPSECQTAWPQIWPDVFSVGLGPSPPPPYENFRIHPYYGCLGYRFVNPFRVFLHWIGGNRKH